MALARLRRREVVILVRQDTMSYFRSRLPSRRWAPLLLPLALVDAVYRVLARRAPTTVVGAQIARRYRAPRENILQMTVSLISEREIPAEPPERRWDGEVKLLTVGRVEPEKNPLLLVEVLARLAREEPGRFTAVWAGKGRLAGEMVARADQLGVGAQLELPGFVPFGPQLMGLYREANLFVHVSHTEGVPGVVAEAMASGLPIVATDVGGVRAAVEDGSAALLVPPDDPAALTEAVLKLEREPALRRRLAKQGLRLAKARSLETEARRVAEFIARV
jgi:glycosyltransferase involved in cell wall biosynthesis